MLVPESTKILKHIEAEVKIMIACLKKLLKVHCVVANFNIYTA